MCAEKPLTCNTINNKIKFTQWFDNDPLSIISLSGSHMFDGELYEQKHEKSVCHVVVDTNCLLALFIFEFEYFSVSFYF